LISVTLRTQSAYPGHYCAKASRLPHGREFDAFPPVATPMRRAAGPHDFGRRGCGASGRPTRL
jgi:hypothetical protein